MKKKLLLLLAMCGLLLIAATSQTKTRVTGTVTGADGAPLEGATIKVQNSSTTTTSNANGLFVIEALPSDKLVVSYVGYEQRIIDVNSRMKIDVNLVVGASIGNEVVVVGYGTQQARKTTAPVSVVKGEDITRRQTFQVSEALQGAVAGVTVTRNSSAPGATSNVRIRGITTFNTNDPLVMIDGVPSGGLNDVNPNDIESISVLKDAAAAAIYGSRAAAGVILITTKRGKSGRTSITYNYEYGVNTPTALPEFVDAKRYQEMFNERDANDGAAPRFNPATVANWNSLNASNPDAYPNTNWQNEMFKSSSQRNRHSITLTTGVKNIKTNASFNYDVEDAIYVNREYKRYTARVNNDITITNKLSAIVDINYKNVETLSPALGDVVGLARRYPGTFDNKYDDGRWALGKDGINPQAMLNDGGTSVSKFNKLSGRIGLEFTPLKGLSLKGIFSPTFDFNKSKSFSKVIEFTDKANPSLVVFKSRALDRLFESRDEQIQTTKQLLADYNTSFGKHNVDVLGGYEEITDNFESVSASRDGFEINTFPFLNLGSQALINNGGFSYQYGLRSYFGRLKYDFNSKYLLEFNFRSDGSSRFAPQNRWGYFPSVSAGWAISDEKFMQKASWISLLKLRVSYGTVGNERVSGSNDDAFKWWPYQALINFRNTLFYQNGGVVSVLSGSQTDYAVSDITWESTRTSDIGLDAALFNNKLSFSFDYYIKNTKDILMTLDIPNYMGFVDPVTNVGEIEVKGWDFQVNYRGKISRDINFSVGANLSDAKSKVLDINGRRDLTQSGGTQISREGNEFSEWFGYRSLGLFQTPAEVAQSPVTSNVIRAGDVKYADINTDGIINEQDKVPLGGSLPRYIYGGNFNITYKNFDLGVVFQGVGKQTDRLSSFVVRPFDEDFGNAPSFIDGQFWSAGKSASENLAAGFPRLSRRSEGNNYAVSDYWFISGAYMRVKNIALGYSLPTKALEKVKLQGLRAYVSLKDFFTINQYPTGWDPEVDAASYPIMKTVTAGIIVKL